MLRIKFSVGRSLVLRNRQLLLAANRYINNVKGEKQKSLLQTKVKDLKIPIPVNQPEVAVKTILTGKGFEIVNLPCFEKKLN